MTAGFIKKYGGTRLRLPDNVKTYPVCNCGGKAYPAGDGMYICPRCGTGYKDEALKGRTWVTFDGSIVVQGEQQVAR